MFDRTGNVSALGKAGLVAGPKVENTRRRDFAGAAEQNIELVRTISKLGTAEIVAIIGYETDFLVRRLLSKIFDGVSKVGLFSLFFFNVLSIP